MTLTVPRRCTSGQRVGKLDLPNNRHGDESCGRVLLLHHFTNKRGSMDAVPVCTFCDGHKIWRDFKQP